MTFQNYLVVFCDLNLITLFCIIFKPFIIWCSHKKYSDVAF